MIRILVTGDRKWDNYSLIKDVLSQHTEAVVIHGCAAGADRCAGKAARELGFTVEEYPALWAQYGRAAGPIRNKQMLDEGKPEIVYAFHNDIANSKGTADMIRQSHKRGLPVVLFTRDSKTCLYL